MTSTSYPKPPGRSSWPNAETKVLRVGHERLRVRESGDGPPLLLINGIGANLDMWQPLADRLADRRLVAFDAPGTGGSSTPLLPRSMWRLSALAARVLDRLGYGQVDVLGISWGGLLAQSFAISHPGRVRRLVLGATVIGVGGVPGRPGVMRLMLSPRRNYSMEYLDSVAPRLFGGRARVAPAEAAVAGARLAHPPSRSGYWAQVLATATYSGLPWLRLLRAPTLVIAGEDDPLVPLVNARMLAALIPRARLYVMRGGGHLVFLDSPELVAPLVTRFLDSHHPMASTSA